MIVLAVGQPYPLPLAAQEGASANLLGHAGSIVQVAMPDMRSSEIRALRTGSMRMGIIVEQPMIIIVAEFRYRNDDPMIFDMPFDARLIPRDALALHDISNAAQRIIIDLHIVDSAKNIVLGLRSITLAPDLTRDLYAAVQDQLTQVASDLPILARHQRQPLDELVRRTRMLPCG